MLLIANSNCEILSGREMVEAGVLERIRRSVSEHVTETLLDVVSIGFSEGDVAALIQRAYEKILQDLKSLSQRDPAARGSEEYVLESYKTFDAVIAFRIANEIYRLPENITLLVGAEDDEGKDVVRDILRQKARQISEHAKVGTGVEIHPAAEIATPFVIDHGIGTVIGETAEIGSSCYLLQGIVLGGTSIADARAERRHPRLGNNVQIGAFARLFGRIDIGDSVTIDAHSVVTFDIPNNSRVRLISQIQVTQPNAEMDELEPIIFGVGPLSESKLCVVGEKLGDLTLSLVLVENQWSDGRDPIVYERHLDCTIFPLISEDGSYEPVVAILALTDSYLPSPADTIQNASRWAIRWKTSNGKIGFVFPAPRFQKWASGAINPARDAHD
jgi:serine acetyltransferase